MANFSRLRMYHFCAVAEMTQSNNKEHLEAMKKKEGILSQTTSLQLKQRNHSKEFTALLEGKREREGSTLFSPVRL